MDISQSFPRMVKRQKNNYSKEKKKGKDSLKVVYISSPMKVKTSASRFMSLVQELTGKNSDIAQYMELQHDRVCEFLETDLNDGALVRLAQEDLSDQYLSSISNSNDTTTCNSSNSFFERVHDGVTITSSQMEEQFSGIFGSDSFCHPSSLVDVLGSYDEL